MALCQNVLIPAKMKEIKLLFNVSIENLLYYCIIF